MLSLKNSGSNNGFYGKTHSDATKKLLKQRSIERNLCGKNNPFYGKHHTIETRKHLSQVRAEKIASGEINPINTSRKGFFQGMRYDSMYELKRMQELTKDHSVKHFKKNNNIIIDYTFLGKNRKYVPDLFIEYNDGCRVIEEIKGHEKPVDKAKYSAARQQLTILGIEYKILYKYDIFTSDAEYRTFLKENKL